MLKIENQLQVIILTIVLMLLSVGIIMIFSTSAVVAKMDPNIKDTYFFIKKQLIWTILAIVSMKICMDISYKNFEKYGYIIFGMCFFLLILVLIPGIGVKYNGARRWIRLAGFGFQPSDFMKFASVIFIAKYISQNFSRLKHFYVGFLPVFTLIALSSFLILLEPDFGTASFILLVSIMLLLVGGVSLKHFIPLFFIGLPFFIYLAIYKLHHIYARIEIYLNPGTDPYGKGFQIRQSLIALGSGGTLGMGLGLSRQKLFFLSEESTDFIFAIIGEELGFLGTVSILVLFILFIYYGIVVIKRAPDIFSMNLALGIIILISLQAIFNIAVVTQTIPAKGISLPLISFGGTGLLVTMIEVGVLLNIAKHCR